MAQNPAQLFVRRTVAQLYLYVAQEKNVHFLAKNEDFNFKTYFCSVLSFRCFGRSQFGGRDDCFGRTFYFLTKHVIRLLSFKNIKQVKFFTEFWNEKTSIRIFQYSKSRFWLCDILSSSEILVAAALSLEHVQNATKQSFAESSAIHASVLKLIFRPDWALESPLPKKDVFANFFDTYRILQEKQKWYSENSIKRKI